MCPDRLLSIVVVTHDSADHIDALLDSLPRACCGLAKEVLVVDSASRDDTAARVRRRREPIRLIQLKRNLGYAAALNAGTLQSRGSHLAWSNADLVLQDGCLLELVNAVDQDEQISAAGPMLLDGAGRCLNSARRFPGLLDEFLESFLIHRLWPGNPWRQSAHRPDRAPISKVSCDQVTGALMVLRRTVANEIGPLDEGYFLYQEETDWFFRAAATGRQARQVPASRAIHFQGGSSLGNPELLSWSLSSRFRFARRHQSPLGAILLWLIRRGGCLIRRVCWTGRQLLESDRDRGRLRDRALHRNYRTRLWLDCWAMRFLSRWLRSVMSAGKDGNFHPSSGSKCVSQDGKQPLNRPLTG